jgi:hypothetical protein
VEANFVRYFVRVTHPSLYTTFAHVYYLALIVENKAILVQVLVADSI